jgi:hypothetical protein
MLGLSTKTSARYTITRLPSSSADSVFEVSISRMIALLFTRIMRSPSARRWKNM